MRRAIAFRRVRTLQQRLGLVAREMLWARDTQLCLVARPIADQLRVWSDPVQFMVVPQVDGTIELVMRRLEQDSDGGLGSAAGLDELDGLV